MKRIFVLLSAVAIGFAPGVAHGATALIVGGAGPYAELNEQQIRSALGGYFADYDLVKVPFPGWSTFAYSIDVGSDNMMAAIERTAGPKTIGGVSKGGPVIDEVLRRLMADPDRPPREELNAVIYGYPNRTVFESNGVEYRPLPETPYDILIVKAEYDGLADWPDDPRNFLAVVNALMGATQLHVNAAFYDINTVPREAPYYIETTNSLGGTTTSILIPTPILPLLRPLAPFGTNPFVRYLDASLRPIIDAAYDRPAAPTQSARTPVAQRSKVETDTSAEELVPVESPAVRETKVTADLADLTDRADLVADPPLPAKERTRPSRATDAGETSVRRAGSRAGVRSSTGSGESRTSTGRNP
ncbi:PE-PPE domain-containing protein [Mycobacterium sp. SMC-4]|uniref:PE-PPE domain-containing protein n=1 Tax=Mycobacterium sp. SMC-4 TaxID=2857059 RepID=UPI0021B2BE19|nr:PE-PPE domain-containing protein [Mycobacterium sp. SMC-4]UXA20400.1 PE-PPE domain-containing protein [Mycobacterium sp. SMC-4]